MFVITATSKTNGQEFDLWFGSSRRTASKALVRLTEKFKGFYINFNIVERGQ